MLKSAESNCNSPILVRLEFGLELFQFYQYFLHAWPIGGHGLHTPSNQYHHILPMAKHIKE